MQGRLITEQADVLPSKPNLLLLFCLMMLPVSQVDKHAISSHRNT